MKGFFKQFEIRRDDERTQLKEQWEQLRMEQQRMKAEDDASRIHLLNPDRICANPSQPRTVFTDSAILKLADSIRKYGMLQPITVRRLSDEDEPFGGLYELIAGERRLRAARVLSLEYVPCIIIKADSGEAARLALVENLQREELNMFEEAAAIASLAEKFDMKQDEIAAVLSVSQSYVANKLRLLRLSPAEHGLILKNNLSERHSRALLRINDPILRMKTLGVIIEREYNVNATEEYITRLLAKQEEPSKPVRKIIIRDIRLFLNSLDRAVSTVKEAGIPIEQSRRDTDEEIELTIRIRNRSHQYAEAKDRIAE